MNVNREMTLSSILWQANQDLAQTCLNHRFVQGIADGNLPRQTFSYYVGQDAFFLQAFARAYSVAAAKCSNWETFQVFHRLTQGVIEELNLHRSYSQEWDVDITTVEASSATRRYTDFLLATAWQADVATIAAAMSPCMRLYLFLGRELAKNGIPDHQYADWICTYGSDEFEPLARQLEEVVDQEGCDRPQLRQTYRYAMQCELDFFEAAWNQFV
ncbi:MAG: thiaminase (transcriptional activator TenA) [Phormidium sp. OSCR]|nr:MAG: thiaminase (transcriptional activator TenA) [Phormidium sp. OSCR]